jgi:hypothetical protein
LSHQQSAAAMLYMLTEVHDDFSTIGQVKLGKGWKFRAAN